MAKTMKTSTAQGRTSGSKSKTGAASQAKASGGKNRKSVPGSGAKSAGGKTTGTVREAALIDVNGDYGNGKVRCKSLVIDGTKYRTRINRKFENRKTWENPDNRKITSSIPGTVIKVYVQEGQEVRAGDQMLILEAMKMKNKIMFHTDGKVKAVHVKEGEKVPKDFLMLELK